LNVASLLLIGQLPIEPEIHRRMINLFGSIIRNFECIERDIAIRQLATKPKTSDSLFIEIVKLLELYELPSPHDLIMSHLRQFFIVRRATDSQLSQIL
jgi:hypothetical protein